MIFFIPHPCYSPLRRGLRLRMTDNWRVKKAFSTLLSPWAEVVRECRVISLSVPSIRTSTSNKCIMCIMNMIYETGQWDAVV